jgi:hypothetical protein
MNMWKLNSQTIEMTPNFKNDNLRDQITSHWKVQYVIRKIFFEGY